MNFLKHISLCLFSLFTLSAFAQNVGIGTSTPNSAALDVASTSKELLLPRVADTSVVSAPAEGLVIYSQADKAPNYFDGNQ